MTVTQLDNPGAAVSNLRAQYDPLEERVTGVVLRTGAVLGLGKTAGGRGRVDAGQDRR